ncbi:hypothetical protein B0T25DRAFT_550411 [Lasiosphaeria hispida]|uniref:Uncharacterized protein n=1 Tax=Lasiosphaeria hispida TaxID=260671 RepID=A0AAJ0HA33_9PEZI|nr:hypothetical protein B0T25DRAFT_550411 [Lasiosphaeria hispida]
MCDRSGYDNPMDDIVRALREIGLRMSVAAATNGNATPFGTDPDNPPAPITQSVDFVSKLVRVQYAVSWPNKALAVVIMLVATVLFWGFWQLGRSFSLSLLEVANAFYANTGSASDAGGGGKAAVEIMASHSGNIDGADLAKRAEGSGDPVVRYGVVGEPKRLAVMLAAADGVRPPKKGEIL